MPAMAEPYGGAARGACDKKAFARRPLEFRGVEKWGWAWVYDY